MATFTNQATLSYGTNVRNSNIVTGEILDVLTATKTPIPQDYSVGDTVTYAVNIINASTADYTGVRITDNLGSYQTASVPPTTVTPLTYEADTVRVFENGVLQTAGITISETNPLVINGITVPAGGNTTIIYNARINEFAPLAPGSAITNTATISGAGIADDIEATAQLPVSTEPNLFISKAVNPRSIVGNGPLTYTFVIANTGNTDAGDPDNIIVSDTFDPRLNITSVQLNGQPLDEGTNYTYDPTTGEFETIAGTITVPAATYTQDPTTGVVTTIPGTSTLTVTGTLQ